MVCSLTAFDRPDYFERVLQSISIASTWLDEDVSVWARFDPSDHTAEMLAMFYHYLPVSTATVNMVPLGCAANTRAAIQDGFDTGADFVFHLEDDLVLAPDALTLTAWLRDTYRDDPDVICVGVKSVWSVDPAQDHDVRRTAWFGCHTWGTWRFEWEHDFLPGWEDKREGERGYQGWDVTINSRIMQGRLQVLPLLSRSQHIGERGTFANEVSYPPSVAPDWDRTLALEPGGPYFEADMPVER